MELHAYAHPAELSESETTRVARLLAIDGPEPVSDVQLARHVADGLLPQAAVTLSEVLSGNRVVGPVIPEATFRQVREAGKGEKGTVTFSWSACSGMLVEGIAHMVAFRQTLRV